MYRLSAGPQDVRRGEEELIKRESVSRLIPPFQTENELFAGGPAVAPVAPPPKSQSHQVGSPGNSVNSGGDGSSVGGLEFGHAEVRLRLRESIKESAKRRAITHGLTWLPLDLRGRTERCAGRCAGNRNVEEIQIFTRKDVILTAERSTLSLRKSSFLRCVCVYTCTCPSDNEVRVFSCLKVRLTPKRTAVWRERREERERERREREREWRERETAIRTLLTGRVFTVSLPFIVSSLSLVFFFIGSRHTVRRLQSRRKARRRCFLRSSA